VRHKLNDLRSLEIGRWYAANLNEEMVERGRLRLQRWLAQGAIHPNRARMWETLLSEPLDQIRAVLAGDNEHSALLRLHAPFAGEMPPKERADLYRRTATEWASERST
jgi:hypothetical protein